PARKEWRGGAEVPICRYVYCRRAGLGWQRKRNGSLSWASRDQLVEEGLPALSFASRVEERSQRLAAALQFVEEPHVRLGARQQCCQRRGIAIGEVAGIVLAD